jgi:hypothetical protein
MGPVKKQHASPHVNGVRVAACKIQIQALNEQRLDSPVAFCCVGDSQVSGSTSVDRRSEAAKFWHS